MGKQENYWKRFEQTGGVLDYLNYTACAREPYGSREAYGSREPYGSLESYGVAEPYSYPEEYGMPGVSGMAESYHMPGVDGDMYQDEYDEEDEVENDDWDAHREWDGAFGYADGRIR
ncbi:MAG: hypothetical protein K2N63_05470 [Lachnospiraceae bacterium]|nr:hypothetical protein [Lachnospiraceae bacterium]